MSLRCCLQSLSSHDSPQMAEHVEGVQVVCEQPLHVQLEDRKKKYQWQFKVHSQVSSVLWRVLFGWGFFSHYFCKGQKDGGLGMFK